MRIGFIFQDFYLMDRYFSKENIMLPMILDKRTDEECIQSMEKRRTIWVTPFVRKNTRHRLSGGETTDESDLSRAD